MVYKHASTVEGNDEVELNGRPSSHWNPSCLDPFTDSFSILLSSGQLEGMFRQADVHVQQHLGICTIELEIFPDVQVQLK